MIAEEFQEGLIILNMESGMYFDVGERLVPTLQIIQEGVCVSSMLAAIEAKDPDAGRAAKTAVKKMEEYGILRPCPAVRKELDSKSIDKILSMGKQFLINENNDLAELIIADPIHDIDPETGRLVK